MDAHFVDGGVLLITHFAATLSPDAGMNDEDVLLQTGQALESALTVPRPVHVHVAFDEPLAL